MRKVRAKRTPVGRVRTAAMMSALAAMVPVSACDPGQSGQAGRDASPGAAMIDSAAYDTGAVQVADENELLSQAARLQSNLNAILASNSHVSGSWFVGDVTAEFTMYYDGSSETYAEEHVDRGDAGTAWRQYYFEAGTLTFFVEEGTRPSVDGASSDSVIVILDFDPQGSVESFYKSIGEAPADLGESEGVEVLRSLERLREGARQAGP